MSKGKLIFFVVIAILLSTSYFTTSYFYNNVPKFDTTKEIVIQEGDGVSDLAARLKKNGLIYSPEMFIIKAKLTNLKPLQAGTYKVEKTSKVENIIDQINSQSMKISDTNSKAKTNEIVTGILFREGLTVEEYADILEQNKIVLAKDFLSYIQTPTNFSTSKYDFLPKTLSCKYGNIDNCQKYYLEGYLYPDTYDFFTGSTPEEVVEKFLNNFNNKVWLNLSVYEQKDFDKSIIMASVLEKETGRTAGVTSRSENELAEERKMVAGVFYNRIENGMRWQSNPTAAYGTDYKLCEITIDLNDCRYLEDSVFNTAYNTYKVSGYPVGAITSPSYYNIKSVLNYTESDYLFFVADNTGKTYFAKTNSQHENNIEKVKIINSKL